MPVYDPDQSRLGALCKNCGTTAWQHPSGPPRTCPTMRTETIRHSGPRLAAWVWLALALCSVADANPERKASDRDRSAEVQRKKREDAKRAERERQIQECIDDRDGDPDVDREICEDEVGDP